MSPHEERRPGVKPGAALKSAAKTTGNILVPTTVNADRLTETEAWRLTKKIQLRLATIADNVEAVVPMIREARESDAHLALGYDSWTSYVATEFGDVLPRLSRAERQPIVEQLSALGMSTRAIAPVVGISEGTVRNDLAGAQDYAPADPITGRDGKTYTRTEPKKPRRTSLPDAYRNVLLDLDRAARRLERLHSDDRFLGYRQELAKDWSRLVSEIAWVTNEIESDLGSDNECRECDERMPPSRDWRSTKCVECRGEVQ